MPKFRKKPVVIEAVKFENSEAGLKALSDMGLNSLRISYPFKQYLTPSVPILTITTREGDMDANVGDYIIKGVQGEFYPCKPDIFEATYEPVEDSDSSC